MSSIAPLSLVQKFNWLALWFVCRGALSVGFYNLAEIKMFQWSEPYTTGQIEAWNLPFTLAADLLTEIVLILIGYFSVFVFMMMLSFIGLRRILEKIFGSPFRADNF